MSHAIEEAPRLEVLMDRQAPRPIEDLPPNPLRGITVLDEAGEAIELEQSWSQGPVVLAFVRHFG